MDILYVLLIIIPYLVGYYLFKSLGAFGSPPDHVAWYVTRFLVRVFFGALLLVFWLLV
jgi:hypothetical protein